MCGDITSILTYLVEVDRRVHGVLGVGLNVTLHVCIPRGLAEPKCADGEDV